MLFTTFLNLYSPLSLSVSVCVSAEGHELLSELQQRRFNGSEGGGGGQGGEQAAVSHPNVAVLAQLRQKGDAQIN